MLFYIYIWFMTSCPCLNIELPASGVMGYLARLASKSKPGIFERKLSTGLHCFKHKEQLSGSSNWGVIPEVIILRFDRDVSEHVHVPMFQLHYPVPAESNSQRGSCETNRVCCETPHNGPRKQTAFTFPNGCSESRDLNVSFNNTLYGLIKKKCVFLATQVFLAILPS